jgi:hypothetical protein
MRTLFATVLAATLIAGPASAQFITSDGVFGADSLITDTNSGTTWLNLDVTMGMSLNAVTVNLALNPLYSDFRFATSQDIIGLFGNAGFCVGAVTCDAITDPARLAAEASFVGAFDDDGSGQYLGYIADRSYPINPADGFYGTFRSVIDYDPASPYVGHAYYDFNGPGSNRADPGTGTWLVSKTITAPIPEPSSYVLVLAGLGGIAFIVRRRKVR